MITLDIHPVRNPRFGSFRTQPLDILSADSDIYLIAYQKKVPGQPNPWNKSWTANSCYANWVYYKPLEKRLVFFVCFSGQTFFPGGC